MTKRQRISMKVGQTIIVTTIVGGLVLLSWRAMLHVPANAARAWALVTTMLLVVLVPGAALAGWWFGHTEARGRLAGIDQAVDRVMTAASKTAGLRVDTTRSMRTATVPPQVALPNVEIISRPTTHKVIEM